MYRKVRVAAVLLPLHAFVLSAAASAQGLETLGTRAAAMAAFVAVADDASAVAWNPSGLVSGPIFNVQIDLGRFHQQPESLGAFDARAADVGTTLIALGTTPVGVGYYRITSTSFDAVDTAEQGTPDRQSRRVRIRTLTTNHLGVTVQQSVGDYVTVGATVKLVRGAVGNAFVDTATWDGAFDRADMVRGDGSTRGDVDLGAMVAAGRVRAGLVLRNLTAPTFGPEDGARVTLDRHVRAGVAWADRWPGISKTVISLDADLTRVPNAAGDRRDVAAGVERWLYGQRVAIRAGVRGSTVDDVRPVVSVGGSYALRAGMYMDVFGARGAFDEHAWGIAARVTY